MKLMRTHPLLARSHQMKRERPFPIGNMAAFHYTAHLDGERFTAGIALIETRTMRLAAQLSCALPGRPAMRTNRAMRPADRLEMLACCVFLGEDPIGKVERLG